MFEVVLVFSRKIHIHMENLLISFFKLNYFIPNFSNQYFSKFLFLVGDRKINKIYQRKIKSDDKLWALKITHGELRLYEKLFCTRQTLQLPHGVSLADLCALIKPQY